MNGGELVSIGLYFKLGGTPDGLKAAEAMGEEAARRSELGDPGLLGRVDAMLKPAPKGDKKR
jgi:hypothetical protein